MSKFFEIWEPVLNLLEEKHPHIASSIVDWYPVGRNEIMVKTNNGEQFIFNYIGAKLHKVSFNKTTDGLSEEQWRNEFSRRLCIKIAEAGLQRWQLAAKTGISEISISKYTNGRAVPTPYNMEKLARALDCPVQELIIFMP